MRAAVRSERVGCVFVAAVATAVFAVMGIDPAVGGGLGLGLAALLRGH